MTRILQSWYLWKNPSNNMGNFTKPRAVVKKHLLQSPLEHHNHSCMSNPYPAWLPEIQWWNLAIWRLEGTYTKELPCLKLMKRFHFWLHEPLPILEAQEACAALCILAAAKACPNGEKPVLWDSQELSVYSSEKNAMKANDIDSITFKYINYAVRITSFRP